MFTMGFDEKFAIRALMRRGLEPKDLVAILIPKSKKDPRAEKALKAIETFLNTVFGKPNIAILEVPIEDFPAAVSTIRRFILGSSERPLYANLSGSMRILVVEALAAIITSGVDAEIELEAEDGSTIVSFRAWDLLPAELDTIDIEILRRTVGGISLPDLARELNMPKSSVWRRVASLERRGLLTTSRRGRSLWVSITTKGLLYI